MVCIIYSVGTFNQVRGQTVPKEISEHSSSGHWGVSPDSPNLATFDIPLLFLQTYTIPCVDLGNTATEDDGDLSADTLVK